MTIKARNVTFEDNTWYYQLYGPDSLDGTVRIAENSSNEQPDAWIAANLTTAQAMIDAGDTAGLFTARQEARNFLAANPAAKNLIDLGPDDLETAIENRTANQETLLLKALSFAVRILNAQLKEEA